MALRYNGYKYSDILRLRKNKPDHAYSYLNGTATLMALTRMNESTTTYQSSNECIPIPQVT